MNIMEKSKIEQDTVPEEFEEQFSWYGQNQDIGFNKSDIPEKNQRHIDEQQKKIKKIIAKTYQATQALERGETTPEQGNTFSVRQDGDRLLYTDPKNGEGEQEITKGMLLTDGEWDINYQLDDSVDSETRKQYLINEAQRKIRNHANKILLLQQSENPNLHHMKRDTYGRILKDLQADHEPFGIIIEKIVKNYFKKIAIDNDLPFKIHDASVIQDVEQKLDFILQFKLHYRGVEVVAEEGLKENVGVQFTVNDDPAKIYTKKDQLKKAQQCKSESGNNCIEEIALVRMDKGQFSSFYNDWLNDKTPGGPDEKILGHIKEELFRKVLDKFLDSEKIDDLWSQIQ